MARMEATLDLPGLLLGSQRLRERGPKSLDIQARRGSCNFLALRSHFADGELRDGERRRGLGQSLARAQHGTGSPDLGSGHPQLAVEPGAARLPQFPSSEQGVGMEWSEVFRCWHSHLEGFFKNYFY